jgi:hypothetical protein
MKRKSKLAVAIATAVFAVLGGAAVYAQDKYALKSPSGIAFSDEQNQHRTGSRHRFACVTKSTAEIFLVDRGLTSFRINDFCPKLRV